MKRQFPFIVIPIVGAVVAGVAAFAHLADRHGTEDRVHIVAEHDVPPGAVYTPTSPVAATTPVLLPVLHTTVDEPIDGNTAPEFRRAYTFTFPWGTFETTRYTKTDYDGHAERAWYLLGDLTERGRSRGVYIWCERPIADQILRPDVARDVEHAIAQALKDDARPLPDHFTDGTGQVWVKQAMTCASCSGAGATGPTTGAQKTTGTQKPSIKVRLYGDTRNELTPSAEDMLHVDVSNILSSPGVYVADQAASGYDSGVAILGVVRTPEPNLHATIGDYAHIALDQRGYVYANCTAPPPVAETPPVP